MGNKNSCYLHVVVYNRSWDLGSSGKSHSILIMFSYIIGTLYITVNLSLFTYKEPQINLLSC